MYECYPLCFDTNAFDILWILFTRTKMNIQDEKPTSGWMVGSVRQSTVCVIRPRGGHDILFACEATEMSV